MERQKNYEELTIRDPFMFGKICSKPENRKIILDALLQIDLHEVEGEVEKYLKEYKNSKYVRLDLISKDDTGKIYNAEMQNKSKDSSRQKELPKRSRYYQALIDTAFTNEGEEYFNLPDTYVIFICTFDPFDEGLPVYTLDTKCNEIELKKYKDGAHKLFFNTTADLSKLPNSIKNMLQYIDTGVTSDDATKAIDIEVVEARIKEEWRSEYMLTLVHDKDVYRDGFIDGKEEGREEGILYTLVDLVKKEIIDFNTAAAQAGMTVEEFEEVMKAID